MAEPPAKRVKLADLEKSPSQEIDDQPLSQSIHEISSDISRRQSQLFQLALLLQKHEADMKKDNWKNIYTDYTKELALRGTRLSEMLAHYIVSDSQREQKLTQIQELLSEATASFKELKKIYEWWFGYWQKNMSQASSSFRAFLTAMGDALCSAELECCISLDTSKQITISKPQLDSMISTYGEPSIVQACSELIARGAIGFPYKRFSMPSPHELLDNLRRYTPIEDSSPFQLPGIKFRTGPTFFPQTFRGQYYTIVASQQDYDQMDVITDYFQEDQRMKARRKDQSRSPMEIWRDGEQCKAIIKRAIARGSHINSYELREAIYETTRVRACFRALQWQLWPKTQSIPS